MVLRIASLLVVPLLYSVVPASHAESKSYCISCHGSHYRSVGKCSHCHRGNEATPRLALAHANIIRGKYALFTRPGSPAVEQGRKLADASGCRRCHSLFGKGNSFASRLGTLPAIRTPEQVAASIKTPAEFMPDFRFEEAQITDVVNAIFAAGKDERHQARETPIVVHFADMKPGEEDAFTAKCGPCHKALTRSRGALGKGDIGPNLSGIFTEFYTGRFQGKERWTESNLKRWIDNPRRVKPLAAMQPVKLKKEEFQELLKILLGGAGDSGAAGESAILPP